MTEFVTFSKPATLEIVRTFPGSIERVWDHLVKDELRRKWICAGAVADYEQGEVVFDFDHSRLSSSMPPDSDAGPVCFSGKVISYQRPHCLAFTWPSNEAEEPTLVTITLKEVDQGVQLHLKHERLFSDHNQAGAASGWHTHLDLLDDLLNNRPVRDFWKQYVTVESHYNIQLEIDSHVE